MPVIWTSVHRPVFATLIFEQILPDGSVVNVELPRSTPWVNSSDRGVVAPQPVGAASEIVLRVRLYSFWLNQTYDERNLTIPVTDPSQPTIARFDTSVVGVERATLPNRSAYVPVGFAVSNRTASQNLVFEQVLPDGRVLNVELPRSNPIIPSAGAGTVRPYDPGAAATSLQFRLTIYDLNQGTRFVSRELSVPIVEQAPTPTQPTPVVVAGTFTAASYSTTENGPISLSWNVPNPTAGPMPVYVWQQWSQGGLERIGGALPTTQQGYNITTPAGASRVVYSLLDANGNRLAPPITITATCTYASLGINTTDVCPPNAIREVEAAYQPFERGFMVWFEGKVYVFYQSRVGIALQDTFTDADTPTIATNTQDVPAGLHAPIRGFGKAWITAPDLGGNWVGHSIGWGTAPEQGYTARVQTIPSQALTRFSVTLPNESVVSFDIYSHSRSFSW